MLQKFYAYGFRGPIFDLIDDYLKDRMQYVFWDKKGSTLLKITTRVRPRSVLGCILFLFYINDLPECAKKNSQIAIFADDKSLVKAGKRKESQIQEDIEKMTVWFTPKTLTVMLQNAKL